MDGLVILRLRARQVDSSLGDLASLLAAVQIEDRLWSAESGLHKPGGVGMYGSCSTRCSLRAGRCSSPTPRLRYPRTERGGNLGPIAGEPR